MLAVIVIRYENPEKTESARQALAGELARLAVEDWQPGDPSGGRLMEATVSVDDASPVSVHWSDVWPPRAD